MKLVFDIESDGLLVEASRVHCLVAKDLDTGQVHKFEPHQVEQGVKLLMQAEQIIGHNIIDFDLPCIQKLYPWFVYDEAKVVDTLILSRLIYPNLRDLDFEAKVFKKVVGNLIGTHKLETWGQRLGYHKMEYSDWSTFTPEMLEYCVGDVEVSERLWKHLQAKKVDPRASELEHQVAFICARQERNGFCFDEQKAQQLAASLQKELVRLEQELQDTFPPFYMSAGVVTPKRTTNGKKAAGTWAGAPYTKIKLTVFNPGSRHHIANRLKKLRGWKPTEFTENGQPKIDETILEKLPWPEAQLLNKYFLVQKRLGLLIGKDEDKGWLNVVRNGRVHGSIITNGAVTGRGTHKVIANIPRVTTPYGMELRSLFCASPGKVQVGVDMSGIELRVFAHFLARWDDGAYGKIVCEGDVHTENQKAAGLPNRNDAKTFIYAFLYGAGDTKIGSIVEPLATERKQRKVGRRLKGDFTQRVPGLDRLTTAVQQAAQRGYLIGLDGRHLHVRKAHAALNTLLQSAAALLSKRWMVEVDMEIERRGWRNKVQQLIWYHDEIQYEADPDVAEELGKVCIECIGRAGDYFGIRAPLTGEAKIGNNWGECH
jgi:DNA polymerase I-like protein with 3'-5' exonuclease and polymerase domains